jgi:sialate O-acetylesterase
MHAKIWFTTMVSAELAFLLTGAAQAEVKPHPLISEGMVIQRGMKAPIWGTANDGEKVTVEFQGQQVLATAKNRHWKVELDGLKAGGPYEMTIRGSNAVHLKNVYVGDVWVCSGQSNMEWPLFLTPEADKTLAGSRNSNIRLFTVPKSPSSMPVHRLKGTWQECSPETARNFSAVAYFFGRDLEKALHVPVGLIHTSWGGTPAESWTSQPFLDQEPALKHYAEQQKHEFQSYPPALEKHIAVLQLHRQKVEQALAQGQPMPEAPSQPSNPGHNAWVPATLYNGMIVPLVPYAIRGAIWYQGESNAGRAFEYRTLLPAMIRSWRAAWKEDDFPFLIVQLAPFMKVEDEPKESQWAELREAQLQCALKLPNVGLAVITDVGEEYDIHPRRKAPVGARLALAARGIAYGEKIEYAGPVFDKMEVVDNKVILSFTHIGTGLEARGGPLTGFTIAGTDRKFVKAEAEIRGDKVVVFSPKVQHPAAVRFGWANYPVVNLWNKEGLPASPFRTDDFPISTNPHKTTAAR